MLSIINEIDPCLLLPLCVLYGIQNQIFLQLKQAFAWIDKCKAAFQELKRYLSNPPLLSPSKEGENLYLYLAVSATAVSAALIREEGKTQLPVYYVSQAFQGAETKYPRIKKIAFALIVASRKLRPYFQANPILVMTDQPIKKSINKLEATGRMVQWAIELSQFDIEYTPGQPSKRKPWRTSSPSSPSRTRTTSHTRLNDG